MPSSIDIASNALVLIGDSPIAAFTEPGAGATAAANLYEETYKAFLSTHPWTFATKTQELSRLSETPDSRLNYNYYFQVPVDCIRIWVCYPINTDYEVIGDRILSNQPDLVLRYLYRVDETALPAHAVKAIEYLLAMDFAQLITENTSKSEYFEQKYLAALRSAMAIDSQGHPQRAIVDSPFLEVR